MTGTVRVALLARSALNRHIPSSRGIMMSETTMSGGASRASASACSPSHAGITSYFCDKRRRRYSRRVGVVLDQQHADPRGLGSRGLNGTAFRRHVCESGLEEALAGRRISLIEECLGANGDGNTRYSGADPLRGQMCRPERYPDGERAAFPFDAFRGNRSAVQPDQLLHERETNARAFLSAAADAFHAVVALEQMGDFIGRHTDARIGDLQLRAAVL